MSHSIDIRILVLDYIKSGGLIKTACELFKVSRSSIQRWRAREEELGTVLASERANLPYKLKDELLQLYVANHPDAYLSEIAAHFGVTESGVWRALSRLKISRKKRPRSIQSEVKKNVSCS
jgi:transposase